MSTEFKIDGTLFAHRRSLGGGRGSIVDTSVSSAFFKNLPEDTVIVMECGWELSKFEFLLEVSNSRVSWGSLSGLGDLYRE